MKTKLIVSLLMMTSIFFQMGCDIGECTYTEDQLGKDKSSGVLVQYHYESRPGGSDIGQCSGRYSEITITSQDDDVYKLVDEPFFSTKDSKAIAALFPDLINVNNPTKKTVLTVDFESVENGTDEPTSYFILNFHDADSFSIILDSKRIRISEVTEGN